MKKIFHPVSVIAAAIAVCALFVSSGCTTSLPEGFAIYLTEENISPSQMESLTGC